MMWGKMRRQQVVLHRVFAVLLGLVFFSAFMVSAAPRGGTIAAGNASISSGTITTIQQFTDKAIINWQSFGIDPNELVQFMQPTAASIALNRVVGTDPSVILGALRSNGRLWLINPNGILFGSGSQVNVGGLLASTLNIKDQDFLNGKYAFTQDVNHTLASIVNQGNIQALDHGYVVMLAPLIDNEGSIIANLGQVKLGGATQAVLNFDDQGYVNYVLSGNSVPQDVVINPQSLTLLLTQVVNNHKIIEAGSVASNSDGSVTLSGSEGLVVNGGTIKANGTADAVAGSITLDSTQATVLAPKSLIQANGQGTSSNGGAIHILSEDNTVFAPGANLEAKGGASGNGGFVEVSGASNVWVNGSVDTSAPSGQTGSFLIDPTTLTITNAAAGGTQDPNVPNVLFATANSGGNTVSVGILQAQTSNITLQATNSITINDLTGGFANGTITLQPNVSLEMDTQTGNITFLNPNNTIIASGTGTITINAGQTGGSGGQAILGNLTTSVNSPSNITVTSDGNMSFGVINACCSAVNLTSTNGSILSSSASPQVVTPVSVTMSAKTGIGSVGSPLVVQTPSISGTITALGAPAYVTNTGGLLSMSWSSNNGDIHFNSTLGDSLTFLGGVSDTLTMNLPNTNATFNNTGGGLLNAGSAGVNVAKALGLSSSTSVIGTLLQPLLTQTPSLTMTTSGAGAMYATNTGALASLSVTTSGADAHVTTTAGQSLDFVTAANTLSVNAPTTAVSLTNNGGAILNLGVTNNISAQSLTLSAPLNGIGTLAQPLLTQTSSLNLGSTGSPIYLTNSGPSLTSLSVSTANQTIQVNGSGGEFFSFSGGAPDTLSMNLPNAQVNFSTFFANINNLGAGNNIIARGLNFSVLFGTVGQLAQPLLTQTSSIVIIDLNFAASPVYVTNTGNLIDIPAGVFPVNEIETFADNSPIVFTNNGTVQDLRLITLGMSSPITANTGSVTGQLQALNTASLSTISVASTGSINSLAIAASDQNATATDGLGGSLNFVGPGIDTLVVNFPNTDVVFSNSASILNLGATVSVAKSLSLAGTNVGTLASHFLTQTSNLTMTGENLSDFVTNTGSLSSLSVTSFSTGNIQINTTTGDSFTFNGGAQTLVMSMPNTAVTFTNSKANGNILNSGATNNITAASLSLESSNGGAIGTLAQPLLMTASSLTLSAKAFPLVSQPIYATNSGPLSSLNVSTEDGSANVVFGVGGSQSLIFTATSILNASAVGTNVTFNNNAGPVALGLVNVGPANSLTINSFCFISNSGVPTNLVANTANLTAFYSIGTQSTPLAINVSTLNATVRAQQFGGVYASNSGPLTLGTVTAVGAGNNVVISNASGDMHVGTVTSGGGISLTSAGSILDAPSYNLTAANNSSLIAGGVVGNSAGHLNVNITGGTLSVSAGGSQGGISADIDGIVSPSNTLVHVGSSPGAGYFNGICLWNCPSSPSTPSLPNPVIPSLSVASVFPDTSSLTYEPSLLDEEDTSSDLGLPLPDILWIFRLPFLSTTYDEVKTYYNQYKTVRYAKEENPARAKKAKDKREGDKD